MVIRTGGPGDNSLTGTSGADRLFGNDGADQLFGGNGNDSLFGGTGNDILYGGGGNDFFDDGPNNDTMYGGDGVDTLFRDYTGASGFTLSVNFVSGAITAPEFPGDPDFFFGIENYGFKGKLNSIMTGNTFANEIRTDRGADTLFGGGGEDRLFAGGGNDTLFGGSGDDTLDDGAGTDTLFGGRGVDTLARDFSGASGWTLDVNFNTGRMVALEWPDDADRFSGIENFRFTGTLDSRVTGNGQSNELQSDRGNDTLFGGGGDDRLIGGRGNDVMTGGTGADVFVFDAAFGARNADTIFFYNVRADSIEIESALVGRLREGTLAESAFVANESGTATAGSHRIIYETDTGRLYFDVDGKGGTTRALIAELSPNLAIANDEFSII